MLKEILNAITRRRRQAANTPEETRIYAVGDIHGRADLVEQLHDAILQDARSAATSRKVAVYIGDYVDRGLQSREVVDLLLKDPLPGFECIHLKGNHEDLMLRFLADFRTGPDWLANGGDATLFSYGVPVSGVVIDEKGWEQLRDALQSRIPQQHMEFFRNLRLLHEEGDYIFVHAGIRPGIAIRDQQEDDLLWIRDSFLDHPANSQHVIVHGHSITRKPDVAAHRIGIDTGAFISGRLTCLILEGSMQRFIQTGPVQP